MSINRITLVGRLTKDPELKVTSTGKSVVEFSVAVNKRIKPQNGPDADFFRVKAWGQTAEYVSNYIQKGRLVGIDGRLEQRMYEDKSGNNREIIEVVADNVHALDRPKENNRKANHDEDVREPFTGRMDDEYDPWGDE
jgi:single-strand DNA-binding protein